MNWCETGFYFVLTDVARPKDQELNNTDDEKKTSVGNDHIDVGPSVRQKSPPGKQLFKLLVFCIHFHSFFIQLQFHQ